MGICSHALFLHLVSDLSAALPTVSWNDLCDESHKIEPWPGISAKEYAALALRSSIFKKFEGVKASNADLLALQKFLESNARCARFVDIDRSRITEIEEICLGEFSSEVYNFFHYEAFTPILSAYDVCANIGIGPGASIGATGGSFYHKLAASPMSGTSKSLYNLYNGGVARKYSLWAETESLRSNLLGDFLLVPGNKLSFVPKTSEISRTICTEPLLNMLFQKGIAAVFESRLEERFGINLSTQPDKNRQLAREGSENGAFGTIDLSSASDSISLGLLRRVLPGGTLSWLMQTRSPKVELPDGSLLDLHMVSSMGNAFTFPLQTILFACVVVGVYRAIGIAPIHPKGGQLGNYAVFGDDIIVRSDAYDLVVSVLKRIGFLVNDDKSFNEGPFRESCGSDFWSGYPVRGVYCQRLSSMQDRYSLINRLNVWSANHGILLYSTIQALLGTVKNIPVPPWESDVSGVKVPYDMVVPQLRRRPHKGLRWSRRFQGTVVYQRWMPESNSLSLLSVGDRPNVSRKVRNNPPGILLSAVSGNLRDGRIMSRKDNVRYTKRLAFAPCWDYHDASHSSLTSVGWRRWVTIFAALNLEKYSEQTLA
jgi:hypothetical protein